MSLIKVASKEYNIRKKQYWKDNPVAATAGTVGMGLSAAGSVKAIKDLIKNKHSYKGNVMQLAGIGLMFPAIRAIYKYDKKNKLGYYSNQ